MNNQSLKIAFAQATFNRDIELTKTCIQRVSPNVDITLISYDRSVTDSQLKWFEDNKEKYNLELIKYNWSDNMPDMRNSYLQRAKELGVQWLTVSDPDELFDTNLAKNLRLIIEKYDKDGYSVLGVNVQDQFQAIGNTDWFDDLDKLKEWPAGYHETDYYKPMLIYKIFPDIKYEGIGVEKNVHETLTTQYKQKTINLPNEFFYVHTKSALTIWRNAARNMFISGGGDNEGSKNRLWVDLRRFCGEIGINTWNYFEKFIREGVNSYIDTNTKFNLTEEQKKEFRLILESALKSLPTKFGTENRETAKWYYVLHMDEVDQKILELIKTIPEITKESELENFVTSTYYQILKRHPDRTGLDVYIQKIMNKDIKRHELVDILKNSPEYKEKFSSVVSYPTINMKNIKSHLNSSDYKSRLTDEEKLKYDKIEKFVVQMYNRILGRPVDIPGLTYYTELIMKKQIKPVDLPDIFRRSEEYSNLHTNKGRMSTTGITGITNNIGIGPLKYENDIPSKKELKMINLGDKERHDTVALCIMGIKSELPFIIESINTMKGVVNEIHVQTDDFTEEDIQRLKNIDERIEVHIEKWKDDFSDYKNKTYSYATTEWIIICDADEIPTEDMAHRLKEIILKSDRGNNFDMVDFDVIDITTVDGKIVFENRNKGGKALLHWNIPSIYYGDLHIWIRDNYYPFKSIHAPVAYKHFKEKDSILERSARNVWIGGGGDTVKEKNELWTELRTNSDKLDLKTWASFNDYLKKGNIDNIIFDIFIRLSKKQWKDEELKDLLKYYVRLHPDMVGYGL